MLRKGMKMMSGKSLWKRIALGAITLILLLGAGALSGQEQVFAAEDDIASGSYGNTTWVIDANGKLTVTGTGEVGDAKPSENWMGRVLPWKSYCEEIKTAEINVTGMTDASYLFSGCINLTSVDVKNFDTSSVTDMSSMFYYCKGLKEVDVSNFNTSKVTSMEDMFGWCSSLTKLDVSTFDTSKVTNLSGMFLRCSSLKKLDVSNFDTSNARNMALMFYCCNGLTKLDVTKFDTKNAIDISEMFAKCSGLTKLDISNFDTSNVTSMFMMFYQCSGLESLDLSNFDMKLVVDYEGECEQGFKFLDGCSSLTVLYTPYNIGGEIELPSSGDTWYRSDGTTVTTIPQNLKYSIAIGKNYIPTEKKDTAQTTAKTKLTTKNTKIKLSKKSYTYDGKAKKPTVKVYNSKGKVLKSKYYTVTYKNNTRVGKATLTIKFKGKYTGKIKATYTIRPKTTALTGASTKKKSVTLTWKKQTKQVSGYQIQYATNSKFTKNKTTIVVNGAKKSSETITGLSGKTKYYFRIRTYKTVKGKKYYSAWSKAREIKTK